ncbi:hypothetical protein EJ08DRAFT_598947, partial [Tothia fuscella]
LLQSPNNTRASTRLSTYSMAPTLTPSIAPSRLSYAEKRKSTISTNNNNIRELTYGLARLDQPKLQKQRYVVSEGKREEIGKLALGAKLERALGRRMVGQDAVFTVKSAGARVGGEKRAKHVPICVGGPVGGMRGEKELAY